MQKIYLAIDLKSFYASVECVERRLNPLTTNLVVADEERTDKTVCLAVTPTLKAYGIGGRDRLFNVRRQVSKFNRDRNQKLKGQSFIGKTVDDVELKHNPMLEMDFVIAKPRMQHYMEVSTKIYQVYLKWISKDDIHVYSIDEVFIDATNYLDLYDSSPQDLAGKLVREIYQETGITATVGIGTNLYLAKVAMDIVAKHMEPLENGLRMAYLDEQSYRSELWTYRPLTDFWRVGRGIAQKLENLGVFTMGDLAKLSIKNEEILFDTFGVNAELLIDHAWGIEPTTIEDIKAYQPDHSSLGSGQVLSCGYHFKKALLVVKEMTDTLSLDLVQKGLVTNHLALVVGYDSTNDCENQEYDIKKNHYGKMVPKSAHGQIKLEEYTSSTKILVQKMAALYQQIVNPRLLVRRIYVTACNVIVENQIPINKKYQQLNLFTDVELEQQIKEEQKQLLEKEKKNQQAILKIREKYGKNAILKGMDLEDGATTKIRNKQIGGHKA